MPEILQSTHDVWPNPGPQVQFFSSTADILVYGGQAGGGKTFALVAEPLRHRLISGFRGGIFRRTHPQITGQGGLWDEACALYPRRGIDGVMRESPRMDCRFPSGAVVSFEHLQHEKTKYDHQGKQYCYLGFDELTHFSATQWLYMLSRNRSTCHIRPYVRATCNPDAGSWVRRWVDWWIGPDGLAIRDRSGVLRYFVLLDDWPVFAASPEELIALYPGYTTADCLSFTFVNATLADNPALTRVDPGYRARLRAQPRIERSRLLEGNWNAAEGSLIEQAWLRRYTTVNQTYRGVLGDRPYAVPITSCRRFASIDTAGTSRDRADVARGKAPSHSVVAVWDYAHELNLLFLAHVWRQLVDWPALKSRVPDVLRAWAVPRVLIEDAHFGPALATELSGVQTQLMPTHLAGMTDFSRGAKLERAIASGFLSRVEDGLLHIPPSESGVPWLAEFERELTSWTGLPDEPADQIDVCSHACYFIRSTRSRWGGVVPAGR